MANETPELVVMISDRFRSSDEAAAPTFEARTGVTLRMAPGPSMGATPDAIPNRLGRGLIADESVAVAETYPGRLTACSLTAGWTSLLVRTFESPANVEPFEMAASPDQLLVLTTRGRHRVESFSHGAWRGAEGRPGMAGLTSGGKTSRLRWRSRAREALETVHIFIPHETVAATIDEYRRAGVAHRAESLDALVFDDPAIARVCLSLAGAIGTGAPDLYAQSAAHFLATHLLSQQGRWPGHHGDDRRPGALSDRRLERVLEYMDARYMEALSLDELAREAGVSPFHFVRLFRARVGVTPHRHLVCLRMDAAAAMLAETDRGVEDIALACGYRTARHFAAAFRRHFSQTPSGYRLGERTI